LADADYEEDILPSYNNGIYNGGGNKFTSSSSDSASLDTGYAAPISDNYGGPKVQSDDDYQYEEDVLPSYNSGIYNGGGSKLGSSSSQSASPSTGYAAPLSDNYGGPEDQSDDDYEEDTLPSYNNGVYNGGGSRSGSSSGSNLDTSYSAPVGDSYGGPSDAYASPSFDSNIASSPISESYGVSANDEYGAPPVNSYLPPVQDTSDDNLPEYYRSEIGLGLSNPNDVPKVDPFSSGYVAPGNDYTASSSNKVSSVVKKPEQSYGVPEAPTINLDDYNVPEVSDKGYKIDGESSYGRR